MAFGRFQRDVGASGSIIDHRHDARRCIEGFEGPMADFRYEVADSPWRLPEKDALVVGYAAPSESAWDGALDALCRVMP
jgi:hypothetical protein